LCTSVTYYRVFYPTLAEKEDYQPPGIRSYSVELVTNPITTLLIEPDSKKAEYQIVT